MDINDLLSRLAQGQKDLRDPAVWQKRCEELFPGTDFTVTFEDGKVKTSGLNPEQQQTLANEVIKISGLV